MALKYHPDKNNGNTSIFIEIQESYEALKDDEFREMYDITWFRVQFHPQEYQRQEERERRESEREAQLQQERENERQRQQCEREAQLQQEREKERQRQQCEREAQLQQEREKEQCHEREKLKRKREADANIQRELLESKTEVEALKRKLCESANERSKMKGQFWKLHERHEALKQTNIKQCQSIDETRREKEVLMQRNVEMEREMRDAEVQRQADKRECGRAGITAELLKICANGVRHNTDAAGIEWYAVIDFMKRVCPGKDKRAVNRTWEFFRDRSKFKDEIAKFTRRIDFRYESTYSPSEAGLGRQNGTPAAQLSGLERMLAILSKKHVGTDFHSLVDKVNE
jgi:curved DNA-binding protein CbpA